MNALALIPFAAWVLSVFVWSYVFGRFRRGEANVAFLAFSGCAALWVTVELLFYLPAFFGLEMLLLRLVILFWVPVGFLFLAFAYALTGRRRDLVYWLSLVATTAGMIIDLSTDRVLSGATRYEWGVADIRDPLAHTILCLVPVTSSLFGLWLLLARRLAATDEEERKTLGLILGGGLVTLSGVLVLSIIIPNFLGVLDFPRFGSSSMAIFVFFVFLAIKRHNFLTIDIEKIADDLFEDVRDGIVITDPDGRVRRMNKAARELTGWRHGDEGFLEDRERPSGYDEASSLSRDEFRIERGGKERVLSVSGAALQGSADSVGRLLLLRDVTEQRQAKRILERSRAHLEDEIQRRTLELQQAQKMEAMGTLAGGIAHDFNNLLAAIIGFSTAAVDETPAGHRARTDFQEVLKAAKQARDIVRQLLGFSRLESPRREIVDVAEVVADVAAILEASLPAQIRLVREVHGEDRATVLADPSSLHQVLMNLATNAFQAIPSQRGRIRLACRLEDLDGATAAARGLPWPGKYVHIEIEDSGHGISPEILERVFEPFFTTREPGKGTGLGLATAKRIIDDHDGAIAVDSAVGRGSSFHVYLPRVAGHGDEDNAAGEGMDPRGDERVMFVSSQEPALGLGRRLLEPLGYVVETFRDPLLAIDELARDPAGFDAVICEQHLSRLSGTEVAARMMAIRPGLPFILVSSALDHEEQTSALQLGIAALVPKPLRRSSLASALRARLGRREGGAP